MADLLFKEDAYKITGLCIEVYNNLGHGFSGVVYKDALEYEFIYASIKFDRGKIFNILQRSYPCS